MDKTKSLPFVTYNFSLRLVAFGFICDVKYFHKINLRGLGICNFDYFQLLKYFYFFQHMKHSQMLIGEKNMIRLDIVLLLMVKDKELVEVLLSSRLTSILMTYLKTLVFLVKTKTLGPRSILKITSRHTRMVPVDKGTISRSFLLEVGCLMTCLKIWRKCFLLVVLTPPPIDIQYRLKIASMDLASTVGLSLNEKEIWLLHTLTVQGSSLSFFCSL